ncbi:MAG: hypothetical protein CM15mP17_13090 [Gammaproteobacteria bacterium]|nr:MAG: hypothetical protein CM15mP17_13090 [Gammaproteobacteria bacterium]
MSSGIKFNEDYADYNSDINRFGRTISFGTPMRDFAKSLENEKEPGTYHHYVSIDTQMLAMVLQEVTGKSVTESLQEHIWNKIGMQDDAYYMVDDSGMEVALGGLNATLRDYAKFGLLYLNRGDWNGEQVVPAEWVDASHATDEDHLVPGDNPNSSSVWGYGYQWWVPGFPSTEYTASGVYNQYIFIDPENKVVIAKTSSNHRFTAEKEESKAAHVSMFRAIASAAAIYEFKNVLLIICLAFISEGYSWWDEGHSLVCNKAANLMSADTSANLFSILESDDYGEGCVWPDVIKQVERRETGPWHYINSPPGKDVITPDSCPKKGCIMRAYEEQLSLLRTGNDAEKKDAVRFIGHFVADIHQPLHTGFGYDRGGNDHL